MMRNEEMEVSHLDLVARAEATKSSLARARIPMTLVSLFIILLGIISEASVNETMAVRVLAIIAAVATVMLWLRSRYSVYPLALLFIATLAGGWLFDDPDYHTVLGSTTRVVFSGMILFVGYGWWTNAMPFVAAHAERLEKERSQVQEWLRELKSPTGRVIEFSVKSFWRGYWTCRLLNSGNCWVAAKFKIKDVPRLLDCRVYELDAVRANDLPGGEAEGRGRKPLTSKRPNLSGHARPPFAFYRRKRLRIDNRFSLIGKPTFR